MANLPETATYDAGVYQLELTDPVIGGPAGISNAPLKNLANRTAYLKGKADEAEGAITDHLAATDPHSIIPVAAPPGAVLSFATTNAPTGWLKANGAAVSRTTYAALFAAISTTFGVGNGSTTFNLPDLRGEFARYWDDGKGIDSGRALGSAQAETKLPYMTVARSSSTYAILTTPAESGVEANGQAFAPLNVDSFETTASSTYFSTNLSLNGTTENTRIGVRPRNVALLACIKY